MKVLITGASGGVGQVLVEYLSPIHNVFAMSHEKLDITDEVAVFDAIQSLKPDVIINPAAMADVNACQQNPERAWLVNALAPKYLAQAADGINATFVHLSTDYVFNGEKREPYIESDKTGPINIYGESKVAGEQNVLANCQNAFIARTAWVMNPLKKGFVSTLVNAAYSGNVALNTQTSSPTGVYDLVKMINLLISEKPPCGIYHLVNSGYCSRIEMATEVFRLLNAQVEINDLPIHEQGEPRRPVFSALLADSWNNQNFPPIRPWQDALAEVVESILS
jgi:dTDP-4-dehydrorhamnose reductase